MEPSRKPKRPSLLIFEPSLGFLGLFLTTLCLVVFFLYLNSHGGAAAVRGFRFSFQSIVSLHPLPPANASNGNGNGGVYRGVGQFSPSSSPLSLFSGGRRRKKEEVVEFLSEKVGGGGGGCDMFDGEWVWDGDGDEEERYPLYRERDCRFLDQGFRCSENGRPDHFYTKWRWQPRGCNLPRFNATEMLKRVQNKRVVFAGDSIGRNQWESMMCLLASGVSNQSSIYEVNGSPITKHKGSLVFKFTDYNCTVEYYRAPFLVLQSRPPDGSPGNVKLTLKLDHMDWSSWHWKAADLLVLNTGHWWNYEKTVRGGCYFQEGDKINMDMNVEEAYRRSMDTVMQWIDRELNMNKTRVFFRTYAPAHFRGGDWRTGGSCHMETLPNLASSLDTSQTGATYTAFLESLSAHSHLPNIREMNILNITHMSSMRKDGHASLYYLGPKVVAPLHRQDCSHWCLPGVPDTWNELLYALYLKHELATDRSS